METKKQQDKPIRGGCLCCPGNEDLLALDTVLYQGFGGFHVTRKDKIYYYPDSDLKWEEYKTLADIEKEIPKYSKLKWEVVLNNPLRGGTWTRTKSDHWVLTDSNLGFA